MGRIIDEIMDFRRAENEEESKFGTRYIESIQRSLSWMLGEWIDELKEGFENGIRDVLMFLRVNLEKAMAGLGEKGQ